MKKYLFLLSFLLGAVGLRAGDEAGPVTVDLTTETTAVVPGEPFTVGVRLTMAPGWHTYAKDPGDSGLPTRVDWTLPQGFTAGEIQWPEAKRIVVPPLVNFGYENAVSLLVEIKPSAVPQNPVTLVAKVRWLACKDICVPGEDTVSLTLPVAVSSHATRRPPLVLFPVLLAFLGGLLLNVMPCVLPVLSIKVLGFVNTPRATLRRHGLLYGLGVVVSFWVLAGLLLALRAGGNQLGWGFQLQSPLFVTGMFLLFFIFGLNLLGVFEIGTGWTGVGGSSSKAAFFGGVLAVLVATPCTAPFMGPALGVALTQTVGVAFTIFTAVGVGLAFPYVLLSFYPTGLHRLPKPGAWMLTLKEFLAFLFFGTAVWLLWVLGTQRGVGVMGGVLLCGVGVGVGAWLAGPLALRAGSDGKRAFLRRGGMGLMVLFVFLSFFFQKPAKTKTVWEPYSDAKVENLLTNGQKIFVDFTASWCLTCQVNERTVLSSPSLHQFFKENDVALLKADWTNQDPDITKALERFGRSGVPLYVVYLPNKKPILLPVVLTKDSIEKALGNP